MNNYPNMSYCMFNNTLLALDQLIMAMREAQDAGPEAVCEFVLDMNREERKAFEEIAAMCNDLIAECRNVEEVLEHHEELA